MTDIGDLTRLSVDLGLASVITTRRASQAVRKAAWDIAAIAKAEAPVDTGATRNSIGVDSTSDGLTAVVGPTTIYAPYLELGTRRMRARPFMGPAADRIEPGFVSAIEGLGGGIL